jgi:hypothetical protein
VGEALAQDTADQANAHEARGLMPAAVRDWRRAQAQTDIGHRTGNAGYEHAIEHSTGNFKAAPQ